MLVHEFATNAAKYGALSHAQGTISVETRREGDRLVMTWREREGPPVSRPSSAEGFGSYLAKATVKTLDGEIAYDWDAAGLALQLNVALKRVQG